MDARVMTRRCPGCVLEASKATNTGIPYKHLLYVAVVMLSSSLPISSIFPFLYYMVDDFHIAKRKEDISFYAGFIGSAFMAGRAITSIPIGIAADRYGRKPVIIWGTISVVIFNTLFGFSSNFYMALTTRLFLGCFCALLGPAKAYATEVCRKEHQALGMSVVGTTWGLGLVIGPAVGGFLAQPADKFPNIVSKGSLLGRFPYLLPCFAMSLVSLVTAIGCLWLPESLHNHPEQRLDSSTTTTITQESDPTATSKRSLLKNRPLMSAIIVYCVLQIPDTAYSDAVSLWAVSPRALGGLSFSTSRIGLVLSITGVGLLVFQLFFYPPVEKIFGPLNLARAGAALTIPLLTTYPFIGYLRGLILMILLSCAFIIKSIFSMTFLIGLSIMQNQAVDQDQRGAANGISAAGMSLFKAVGPTVGGSMLSWAQSRRRAAFLPGSHMFFFLLNVMQFVGLLTTFKPFMILPPER